jgi:hypothetical protein
VLEGNEPQEREAGQGKADHEAGDGRSETALGDGAAKDAEGPNNDAKNEKQHTTILRGI